MVAWATTALVEGWDSPALRILAGLDVGQIPRIWETAPYLERALTELSIPLSSADQVVREYVDEIASLILAGAVEPQVAVKEIHTIAVSPLEHPRDLQPWCDLNGGLEPGGHGLIADDAYLASRIRECAREWLNSRRSAA